MNYKTVEIEQIKKDIKEINDVFNAPIFDRSKAERIISKHNLTDKVIGSVNSPHNPYVQPLYMHDDDSIKANLRMILDYLTIKLAKEQHNG